jgi:outer membrane protein
MKIRELLFLPFLILAGLTCHAQQSDVKVWTLRECIDYAVSNNLTIKRNVLGVETSEINYMQSRMAMLPTLNTSGGYGFNWGRSIDPTTNQFIEQRIKSININATSSLLLWNGFRLFYAMKQSDVELDASNEDLIKTRNDVILNVITIYLNVIVNKELYNNAQTQLSTTEQQLERTRKLAEAGSVPRADVLNLEAQHATNELNLIQRENALNLSMLQLKQALQLPASIQMDIEIPQLNVENQLVMDKTAEEIFDIATISMPEIKAAQLRRRSAAHALRSARGSYYPRLSLNGSISTLYSDARKEFIQEGSATVPVEIGYLQSNPAERVYYDQVIPQGFIRTTSLSDQFSNNLGKSLGLNLTIPIFNGYATRANVQRTAINRELADITYTETENRLRQSVESAYNDATAAAKTYSSSQKQVQARTEAFRMTKQRYELGAVNFVEYQVSENDLFQAQSDLLRAKYDFIFKKKVLDFYQGKPLEF